MEFNKEKGRRVRQDVISFETSHTTHLRDIGTNEDYSLVEIQIYQ